MPFNLGPFELIFVMVVLLLVFGAKRLPELGSGLGKGIREFKRSIRDMNDEVQRHETPHIEDRTRTQVPPASGPPASTPVTPESETARRDG
jgi:sec-independent protein translocase protein TatA